METPKDQQHHAHHQSSNTIDQILDPSDQASLLLEHDKLNAKTTKDRRIKRTTTNERTHTPPPPSSTGRIMQDKIQQSHEKTIVNSSSFYSKKQTAYINPKEPTDEVPINNPQIGVPSDLGRQPQPSTFKQQSRSTNVDNSDFKFNLQSQFSSVTHSSQLSSKYQHHSISHLQQIVSSNKSTASQPFQSSLMVQQLSFTAHSNTITSLDMDCYHSNQFFSASLDHSIKVWNVSQNLQVHNLSTAQALSPQTIKSQKSVIQADINPILEIKNKQRQKIQSILFLSNLNVLASAGFDKQIKLYNMKERGQLLSSVKGGHQGVINKLCRIDEDQLASACSDHFIRIFSLSSKTINTPVMQFEQKDSGVNNICRLGTHSFLTSGYDKGVRIWDVRQQEPTHQFEMIHYEQINSIDKLSSNVFATGSDDSYVNVWDIRMAKLLKQVKFENERVGAIKFVRTNFLIAAHEDQLSILSYRDNFNTKHTFQALLDDWALSAESTIDDVGNRSKSVVKSLAYSEYDQKLYTGGFDKKINVWSIDFSLF